MALSFLKAALKEDDRMKQGGDRGLRLGRGFSLSAMVLCWLASPAAAQESGIRGWVQAGGERDSNIFRIAAENVPEGSRCKADTIAQVAAGAVAQGTVVDT